MSRNSIEPLTYLSEKSVAFGNAYCQPVHREMPGYFVRSCALKRLIGLHTVWVRFGIFILYAYMYR